MARLVGDRPPVGDVVGAELIDVEPGLGVVVAPAPLRGLPFFPPSRRAPFLGARRRLGVLFFLRLGDLKTILWAQRIAPPVAQFLALGWRTFCAPPHSCATPPTGVVGRRRDPGRVDHPQGRGRDPVDDHDDAIASLIAGGVMGCDVAGPFEVADRQADRAATIAGLLGDRVGRGVAVGLSAPGPFGKGPEDALGSLGEVRVEPGEDRSGRREGAWAGLGLGVVANRSFPWPGLDGILWSEDRRAGWFVMLSGLSPYPNGRGRSRSRGVTTW